MKSFIRYGLAVAIVFATAMPAMARTMAKSWDVCVDLAQANLATGSNGDLFSAAGPVFPEGTLSDTVATTACPTSGAVGTFFATGGSVSGQPGTSANDVFMVQWHFRINGQGAFDTMGPVESTSPYPQTIVGSSNRHFVPSNGTAQVTTLPSPATIDAFRITTPEHGNNGKHH